MRMKIKIQPKGTMTFTGEKILKSIMDKTTPPVDLLIRESIQNSLDATLQNKSFGRIEFNHGNFKSKDLANKLELVGEKLKGLYRDETYSYLLIKDTNTCGLLGTPFPDEIDGEPRNLYNLVYSFMSGKDEIDAGGSWGVGKSVYYRYGIGLCFYYSRTYEKGNYIHKLVGALIQDEKSEHCLLGKHTTGICFFGDIEKKCSVPIKKEKEIKEFLSIFNIEPYQDDMTGTVVIIPYLDDQSLTSITINKDSAYWKNSVEDSIRIALQRWYFPRLNNPKFNGKYLLCSVNGLKVELNDFFKKLQELYNGEAYESVCLNVCDKKINNYQNSLGKFIYKSYSKEELGVCCAPNNLPSPYVFLDIDEDNRNENSFLFYTRKSGMIINYDNNKFKEYKVDNDYLIGVFILNDEMIFNGERLGNYIRKSEKGNHMEWSDIYDPNFEELSEVKPFKRICNSIIKMLNEKFGHKNVISIEGAHSIFQKKLGKKLMPPEDYGDEPTEPKPPKTGDPKIPGVSKKKRFKIYNDGFKDGYLTYILEFYLEDYDQFEVKLFISTNSKEFDFNEWEKMEFKFPCKISKYIIEEYCINNDTVTSNYEKSIDENSKRTVKKNEKGMLIFSIEQIVSDFNKLCGLRVINEDMNKLKMRMKLLLEPINPTYSIVLHPKINKDGDE